MPINIIQELIYKTARSGGKGGQNVNKVETMVEGYWHIQQSTLINDNEKALITAKLANKINSDGFLLVKSQTARTQLANKIEVGKKINVLVEKALFIPTKRKPTKIPKTVVQKRLDGKKKDGLIKQQRKKIVNND